MKSKTLFIGLVVIAISALIVGIVVFTSGGDLHRKEANTKEQETNVSWVIASEDELLGKYEKSDKQFTKRVFDDTIGYWHSRRIDDAKVEKDHIRYLFDRDTKELIEKDIRWRDDLPEHLPEIITKEEAESMVGGKIMYTNLWYISPKSHVFPIKPTPKNPCWTVSIADDKGNNIDVIIIDAVEGKILGHGVPIP
jgi:flagellar basal body-associated protein FliL